MKLPSVKILLCLGLVAVVYSAAIEKKEDAKKLRSIAEADDPAKVSDDVGVDLLRSKKSPTTTFCVEIKPGNDEPTIVACDPTKTETQQPISPHVPSIILPPTHTPDPHPEHPPHPVYEPIGIISQPPQILPSYYPQQPPLLPPWYPQPVPQTQIIFVKDPSCASNQGSNPNPSPWATIPSGGYGTGPRAAMDNPGYKNIADEMRSFSGIQQLSSNGLSPQNPLDLIYPRQGSRPNTNNPQPNQSPQYNSQTNQSPQYNPQSNQPSQYNPQSNQPSQYNPQSNQLPQNNQQQNQWPQYNQQPDQQNRPTGIIPQPPTSQIPGQNQFDRPLLIQCNPSVIPLSPAAYAAATNNQNNRPNFRTIGGTESSRFLYQPAVVGSQALYMPYDTQASSYMKNAQYQPYAVPEGMNYQQFQSNIDGFGQGRAVEDSQGISAPVMNQGQIPNVSTKGMQTGPQAGEQPQHSQLNSQFTSQNQGAQGEVKGLAMDQQQNKNENMAQTTQDQGTQRQIGFDEQGHHHQSQQKAAHDQRLMNSYKSKTNMPQGNIIQPYANLGQREAGKKQSSFKV